LNTIATGIHDKLARHTGSLESWGKGSSVTLLVLALVVLGIRGTSELSRGSGVGVPSYDVVGYTHNLTGGSSSLVD